MRYVLCVVRAVCSVVFAVCCALYVVCCMLSVVCCVVCGVVCVVSRVLALPSGDCASWGLVSCSISCHCFVISVDLFFYVFFFSGWGFLSHPCIFIVIRFSPETYKIMHDASSVPLAQQTHHSWDLLLQATIFVAAL